MSITDKALNITIACLVVAAIGIGIYAFLPDNSGTKSSPEASSVKTEKASSKSKSSAKKSSHSQNTSTENTTDNVTTNRGTNTQTSNTTQASQSSNSTGDKVGHGTISNGMDYSYRAAKQAGLIDDYTSRQEFYGSVQEHSDGSFTYNGQTVYSDIIHEGNPNGVYVNGEHYTDPDRFSIYTK